MLLILCYQEFSFKLFGAAHKGNVRRNSGSCEADIWFVSIFLLLKLSFSLTPLHYDRVEYVHNVLSIM